MSRFDGDDGDGEGMPPQLWMQAVRNALKGKRGQAILRELKEALLSLPRPHLISGVVAFEGEVCPLGALARRRIEAGEAIKVYGRTLRTAEDLESMRFDLGDEMGAVELGEAMGLKRAMAWGLAYENDEGGPWKETDAGRYQRILGWIEGCLEKAA